MSCFVGVPYEGPGYNRVGGNSLSAAGRQASVVYYALQDGYGELTDGAWRPREWAQNDQASGAAYCQAMTSKASFYYGPGWGILADMYPGGGIGQYAAYKAASPSDNFQALGWPIITQSIQTGARFFIPDIPQTQYLLFENKAPGNQTKNGGEFGELQLINFVAIDNNQELVSYRRERIAPAAQSITTLDGTRRTYVTGYGTAQITATWRWSDNGTIAAALDTILAYRAERALPLMVYIPAGIYYNGPFIDLVMPDNDPTIIMPAPGVYELTISGRCQP